MIPAGRPDCQRPSRVAGKGSSSVRMGAEIVTSDELIDQLNSADGEIYIADPSERVRSQYRRAIHGAKDWALVPEGFQLWHTGRDRGDMVIRVLKRHTKPPRVVPPVRAPETARVPVIEKRVKLPTIDLNPALASLAVSKGLLPRCRTILQQLTDEALRRGYEVLAGIEKSSLVIVASGEHLPFRLFEEQDSAPAPPPTKAELRRYTWRLPPSTIRVPTGRLALRLDHHYRNRTWADRSRWRLEDRLTEVIDHVDSLARAEIERQREAHEKGLRDLEAWEAGATAARACVHRRSQPTADAEPGSAFWPRPRASRIRESGPGPGSGRSRPFGGRADARMAGSNTGRGRADGPIQCACRLALGRARGDRRLRSRALHATGHEHLLPSSCAGLSAAGSGTSPPNRRRRANSPSISSGRGVVRPSPGTLNQGNRASRLPAPR